MYQYAPLLSKNYPTLADIKTAIQQAETTIEAARDQRPLFAILHRMATASPRLQGLINTRKIALRGYKYVVTGDDVKKAEETQKRLAKTIDILLSKSVDAQLFGSFLIQLSWELSPDKYFRPKVIKDFLPFEIGISTENILYKAITGSNGKLTKEIIDGNYGEYIYAKSDLQITGGILRSLIYHEFLRDATVQEWWNYNKKLKGLIQAKADDGQKADAAEALDNFIRNNYAVTDKDVEFLVNDLTSAKSLDSFRLFIEMINNEISIAVLGQANVNDLPSNGGSRAALQIQELIRKDILYSDMLFAKKIINEQLLVYDYKRNVDKNAEESPFIFDFIYDDNIEIESQARVIEIAIQNGIPLIKSEVYKNLGLTTPKIGDELLEVNNGKSYNI
ncbi:MAG: DUF935 family protein [Candidatus Bilamarchaeaceae archaeon]